MKDAGFWTLIAILIVVGMVLVASPRCDALEPAVAFFTHDPIGSVIYHVDPNYMTTEIDLAQEISGVGTNGITGVYDSGCDELLLVLPDAYGVPIDDFHVGFVQLDGSVSSVHVDIGATLEWTVNATSREARIVHLGNGDRFILGWSHTTTGTDTVFGFNVDAGDPNDIAATYQEHTFSDYLGAVLPLVVNGSQYVYFIFPDGSGKRASIPFSGFTDFDDIGGFNWAGGNPCWIQDAEFDGNSVYIAGGFSVCTNPTETKAMICGTHDDDPNPENWTMEDVTSHVLDDSYTWVTFGWTHGMDTITDRVLAKGWGYARIDEEPVDVVQNVWAKEHEVSETAIAIIEGDTGDCGGSPDLCGIGSGGLAWIPVGSSLFLYNEEITKLIQDIDDIGSACAVWPVR